MIARNSGFWLKFAAVSMLAGLTACTGATAYKAADHGGAIGYLERRLPSGHYEVTFTGGINTDLKTVKYNLMRRAAELTLAEGYTHFVLYTNRTEAEVFDPPKDDIAGSDHGLAPAYSRRNGGRFSTASGWPLADLQPGEATPKARYIATAEIILLKDAAAKTNEDALSAKDVLAPGKNEPSDSVDPDESEPML